MGSHSVVGPVVEEADKAFGRENVLVVTEGIAAERFFEAGRRPFFTGTKDFRVMPFTFDCRTFLEIQKPDVVVVGEGFPINLERQMAHAANNLGIPVVSVSDFWGGVMQLLSDDRAESARPDLMLTLDIYAAELAKNVFPGVSTRIVGNPGVKDVHVSQEVEEWMRNLRRRFDTVYVFGGGGWHTTADLAFLITSLEQTPGDWCLVPLFHPKWVDLRLEDDSMAYGELWTEMLESIADRIFFPEADNVPKYSGEEYAVCGDVFVSCFSTLMTTAAQYGKTVLSLQTSEYLEALAAVSVSKVVPQVALGCAHAILEPTDLSVFGPMDHIHIEQTLKPFCGALAFKEIMKFLDC